MKLKKLFAVAIAAVMSLSIVGCGEKADKDDLTYIKDNGKMVIGYTVMNPLNYTDENGDFVGFETEFAKEHRLYLERYDNYSRKSREYVNLNTVS